MVVELTVLVLEELPVVLVLDTVVLVDAVVELLLLVDDGGTE